MGCGQGSGTDLSSQVGGTLKRSCCILPPTGAEGYVETKLIYPTPHLQEAYVEAMLLYPTPHQRLQESRGPAEYSLSKGVLHLARFRVRL